MSLKITEAKAIKVIEAAGWKKLHPGKPLYDQYYFDGINRRAGYAWLSAYEEIKRREQPKLL